MALLTFAWDKEKLDAFKTLYELFPVFNAQVLGYIGSQEKR